MTLDIRQARKDYPCDDFHTDGTECADGIHTGELYHRYAYWPTAADEADEPGPIVTKTCARCFERRYGQPISRNPYPPA